MLECADCACCSQSLAHGDPFATCTKCRLYYHEICVETLLKQPVTDIDIAKWVCPACKPKSNNADNTPIRASRTTSMHGESSNITQRKKGTPVTTPAAKFINSTPVTSAEVQQIVQNAIGDLMKHLNETLASYVNKELKSIKVEIGEVKSSIDFLSQQYDDIKKDVLAKLDCIDVIKKENEELKSAIKDLNMKMNVIEQQSRSCNVEVQCLPEFKGENLVNTIINLGKVIACDLADSQLHHVTRIAKMNSNNPRPRSIVAQFSSPRVRDTFLAAAIKYNKNNPNDKLHSKLLGIGGSKENIYVMEHLSPGNKALHAAARLKAKEKSYKYVWVRNGRIFMRKSDDSDFKYIKDYDSLSKLD